LFTICGVRCVRRTTGLLPLAGNDTVELIHLPLQIVESGRQYCALTLARLRRFQFRHLLPGTHQLAQTLGAGLARTAG
jgi:hypothetical protein